LARSPPILDAEGEPFERRHADLDEEEGREEAGRPELGVAVAAGTVFHCLLERWDRKEPGWLIEAAPALAGREADDRGLSREAVVHEVGAILEPFLASTLPARLASLDVIGREMPVLHPDGGGGLVLGVVDLLYRDAEGQLRVADYKTDLAASTEIPSLVGRYRGQLGAYVRAVRAVLAPGTHVGAELWLVRLGRVEALAID
jgi:ATP-dependent exoDNAse (exonuclease V) beta subunit